ncbi:hypothetical protein LOTGIDRAFT_169544 [Lottia gigantea]|uniref:Coiled-coil domain-containing protein 43 n=1 Tax=Lottia gigantea TaxID=225164 RepID=V3ZG62_LOTGI|nr:hypothetical protein LOTGIDRAFT_169544 [Lottia gigantea]ESO83142.1 hypothetical protein LOTGIDRAFT_169544 [Lottia gigantea]
MEASMEAFQKWLDEKLLSLDPNTDTEVFGTYIIGILESESDEEEQKESMAVFFSSLIESGCEEASIEIYDKWKEFEKQKAEEESKKHPKPDITDKLGEIFEKQKLEVSKVKSKSKDEKARKEAILNQYCMRFLVLSAFKNTNSEDVAAKERAKRDAAKAESDRKREKDKLDRETQKNKQADRKEAEKKRTQKGERRR